MKKFSIKFKIMLWFSTTILILVVLAGIINLSVSRHVLDQSLKERLVTIVTTNAEEIEYYNSKQKRPMSEHLSLSYKGGILEIDDDFCDYYEGVCTALVDSDGNLLYGEAPFTLADDEQFTFDSVGETRHKGQIYYVYEKKLSGENLDGLWLRGVISEYEVTYVLKTIVDAEIWLIPLFSILVLFGGYMVTKRSFLPIGKISAAADQIANGNDLTKRIDIGKGDDELHKLSQTFNEMLNRLERSFESEKQFTSDASHELRTPLSIIKANCEFALQFAENEEDFREALEVINRQSDKISALITQLLFFARVDNAHASTIMSCGNLSTLVKSICDDRTIILDNERNFKYSVKSDIYATYDENLISRLLNNLLDNAVKYSQSNDSIKVTLDEKDDSIILSVEDEGSGISPENIDKIWNRFYQVETSRSQDTSEGFGLGLSMVKEIATLHNGRMEVASTLGKGSKFSLILPKD